MSNTLAEAYGFDLVFSSARSFGDSDAVWLVSTPSFAAICRRNRVTTSALFRRSAWAHAGGFRDFGLGADHVPEDWDFWLRLLAHGAAPKAIAEPLLHYRVHSASLTASNSLPHQQQRDRILAANAALTHSPTTVAPAPRRVSNPFVNLSSPLADPRPGFLLALPCITVGGAENLLLAIARHMAARGFRLIVITTTHPGPGAPDLHLDHRSLTPYLYPLASLFDDPTHAADFILHLVRRYRVSGLLFAGADSIYHLLPRLKESFPNLFIADQVFNDQAFAAINRHYRHSIDATIVPSRSLKSALESLSPDSPGRIEIIPHAIAVPPLPGPGPELPFPVGAFVVAFFGRLAPGKGALDFIALARALSANPRFHFILAGDGPERAQALDLIARASLSPRFHAPGFVDPASGLMSSAHAVVVPSTVDGMPLVILEAQSLALPVVASAVGSIPSMIEDGETGFLCDPGALDQFKRRVEQLAADPALASSIGAAARRFVLDHYSQSRMLDSYARLFLS